MEHGIPMDRFPLYTHQEKALLSSFSNAGNLLVATGTGSGKTEAFVLPILARILSEAYTWSPPIGPPEKGYFDIGDNAWRHSRRHETREAAVRAIILYPMNALVNDQMSRLRRILALSGSTDWQLRNLNGNVVHFGMYTSLTQPTRGPEQQSRRQQFDRHLQNLQEEWDGLTEELRNTGNWPVVGGSEMLCRWDMQGAPPDILVTNYSMLEYMLIRPIESTIFDATRNWLAGADDRVVTLVLDEAHTYTGAKGTEVAHLVRRLKDRLGIASGSNQFRAIATSASIPAIKGAESDLVKFTADLFGEPDESFTVVHAGINDETPPSRSVKPESLAAFARFHDTFVTADPWRGIEELAQSLRLAKPDDSEEAQVALYRLLLDNEDVMWVRARTARNATRLSQLAQECWPNAASPSDQERATAGLLAAGSFARPTALPDTPPILSMRVHAFFRGVPGFWACLNPDCPEVPSPYRGERPVGRVYTDPRPWCSDRCGGRVLELFSCRKCGLLFVGGIPDKDTGSLWPWSDDFSGEGRDPGSFRIFGVERPHADYAIDHRSTKTTLPCRSTNGHARPAFRVKPATDQESGREVSAFPNQCPRCQNYRSPQGEREIIEPLRTRGPRSISVIVEDVLRVQSDVAGPMGSGRRKALVFSDSRQDAAQLAADLRNDHQNDLFRQLLFRVLHSCSTCDGRGVVQEEEQAYRIGQESSVSETTCEACQGRGYVGLASPVRYQELRSRVIDLQIEREIDPTIGFLPNPFERLNEQHGEVYHEAMTAFDVAARREISQEDFALEPLGLATWSVVLPEQTGQLEPLTEQETQALLRTVARILATENILLPPEPAKPWEWPFDNRIQPHERQRIIPGNKRDGTLIPYNLYPYRKLGRYVGAVAKVLARECRIADEKQWLGNLRWPLWNALKGFRVLVPAGRRVNDRTPHGIRIDSFELHPMKDTVFRCSACHYIMGEVLLGVCYRCGQTVVPVDSSTIRNYFRRSALFAKPGAGFSDPYSIQATEHTAAISRNEARDIDPVFNLRARDAWIGWNQADRREKLVNMMDAYVVGAVPPYSDLLGGKLITSLIASKEVADVFEERYGDREGIITGNRKKARLALVTVTSALGRSSMYNRLKLFANDEERRENPPVVELLRIGTTTGYGHFQISEELFSRLREFLRETEHPYVDGHQFGNGPNWRIRLLRVGLESIGLNAEYILKHGIQREVYVMPIASNSRDFLAGKDRELVFNHRSVEEISNLAKGRWIVPRAHRDPSYREFRRERFLDPVRLCES